MKKYILFIIAILLFIFYSYCFLQWLQSDHTFKNVWNAATSDWFLAVTLLDLALFASLCLIWLVKDMIKKKIGKGKIFLVMLSCLIYGVVPFLIYLAFRKNDDNPALEHS